VYDVHAGDNEFRSAEWAAQAMQEAGCDWDAVQRVHQTWTTRANVWEPQKEHLGEPKMLDGRVRGGSHCGGTAFIGTV
jgi:hypothetical protein